MAFRLLSAIKNQHFHSLTGNVISAFFNILSFAILVRILPASEFGEWVLFIATFGTLDQLRTAMLQSGLIKFYAGQPDETGHTVLGAAWYVALFLSLLYLATGVAAAFSFAAYLSATWYHFLLWLGPMLVLSLPFNFASWVLQASNKFDKIVQLRVVQNGSFLLFIGLLFATGHATLGNVMFAYLFSLLLTSIYSMIFRWTFIRTIFVRTRSQVRELVRYGRFIVGTMLSSTMLSYSSSFLIRTFINPAAVAVYSIPQKFIEVIEIVLRSFVATAQPTLSAAVNRNDWREVSRAFCRYTGAVTILIAPFLLMMIVLVKPLIIIVVGKDYLHATGIVLLFLASAILYPIDRFLGVTLDMIDKPEINFYKNAVRLLINVVGGAVLMYFYPTVWSMAIIAFVGLVVAVAQGYYLLARYLDISMAEIVRLGRMESLSLLRKILSKFKLIRG